MGNSLRLYHTIMEFLFNSAVQRHDIRVFSTLAWAIVGLLFSHHISLNRWCQHRPGAAQAESKVRKLARWLHRADLSNRTVRCRDNRSFGNADRVRNLRDKDIPHPL